MPVTWIGVLVNAGVGERDGEADATVAGVVAPVSAAVDVEEPVSVLLHALIFKSTKVSATTTIIERLRILTSLKRTLYVIEDHEN
ncbi:MAG TPA: hypothetical protein VNE38_13970 [Ktedonobacteraceae bacterium]|nr:hypothetical protein [Ktedonobacteraceae bacterium]